MRLLIVRLCSDSKTRVLVLQFSIDNFLSFHIHILHNVLCFPFVSEFSFRFAMPSAALLQMFLGQYRTRKFGGRDVGPLIGVGVMFSVIDRQWT